MAIKPSEVQPRLDQIEQYERAIDAAVQRDIRNHSISNPRHFAVSVNRIPDLYHDELRKRYLAAGWSCVTFVQHRGYDPRDPATTQVTFNG